MSGHEVIAALIERKIDVGISQYELDSHAFIQKSLFQDRFSVTIPESWSVRSKKMEDLLEELFAKPYLSYGTSDPLVELARSFGKSPDLEPHRSFPSWPILVEMIRKKMGWSVVPQFYLREASGVKTFEVPEKAIVKTHFRLYYPREFSHHGWFQEFIQTLRE